jgi:hypothetical protein
VRVIFESFETVDNYTELNTTLNCTWVLIVLKHITFFSRDFCTFAT